MDDEKIIRFIISEELNSEKEYREMKELLANVGILMHKFDDQLSLIVLSEYYDLKSRGAGRHDKFFYKDKEKSDVYHYSDIIYMQQSMKNKDIIALLKIPSATFSRHLKRMKESYYYKTLDKTRLNDIDYLKSVKGNFMF